MTGQQFTLCLKDGVRAMGRLTVGMEIAVSSSLWPPMARMEMDYNLKSLGQRFQVLWVCLYSNP